MMELTERERIINTLNVSMLNWQIKMIPEEKKIAFLHALLKTKKIEVTEQYLIDLVNALNMDNVKAVSENIDVLGMWGKILRPMG
jgi:hypothetical protein